MTWGRDTDENEAAQQLQYFVEAGGNLFDTAAVLLVLRFRERIIQR
jgi:aryl-alcohol dehydrogenase-like predicted oxidoreductase